MRNQKVLLLLNNLKALQQCNNYNIHKDYCFISPDSLRKYNQLNKKSDLNNVNYYWIKDRSGMANLLIDFKLSSTTCSDYPGFTNITKWFI